MKPGGKVGLKGVTELSTISNRSTAACLGSQKQLYGVFQFIVIDELLDLRVCYMWARL